MDTLKRWAKRLKDEITAVYLASRHPKTPWYAKAVALIVTAYALSPIDLIPDFIPVLGHLDDVLLVPLGLWIAIRLVPAEVMAECREAATAGAGVSPRGALDALVRGRVLLRSLLAAYVAFIVVGSLGPAVAVPVDNFDKFEHMASYALLGLLVGVCFDRTQRVWALAGAIMLGASLEVAQHFTPGRMMSVADQVANTTGVVAGALAHRHFERPIQRFLERVGLR